MIIFLGWNKFKFFLKLFIYLFSNLIIFIYLLYTFSFNHSLYKFSLSFFVFLSFYIFLLCQFYPLLIINIRKIFSLNYRFIPFILFWIIVSKYFNIKIIFITYLKYYWFNIPNLLLELIRDYILIYWLLLQGNLEIFIR